MTTSLLFEALSVGVLTAILGSIISIIFMYAFDKSFNLKKYTFWPQVFLSYFTTGFLFHLFAEWSGFNKKFCCQASRYSC